MGPLQISPTTPLASKVLSMKYIPRLLAKQLLKASKSFPAILLTGPRQSGKTTLLKQAFPKANYILLEDPDIIDRVKHDPRTFLDSLKLPVILDEIQNAPELLGYIRTRIDENAKRKGMWLLTGSQEAPLMHGVAESMAGRVAILQLLPFSIQESNKVTLLKGGYPDVIGKPSSADLWFRSYLQTYLERDVRAIAAVKDLTTFRRFIALLASRHGSMLNKTDLAAPLGVSVPTITHWLNILELTGQLILVPPFYENFGKRLVKTPKVFFADSGLACHLLGIETLAELNKSPFIGALFEGFVAAEIVKHQLNQGKRKELYYFRDLQGLEVDFVVPKSANKLTLIEAKSTKTPKPSMAKSLQKLKKNIGSYQCQSLLVHNGTDNAVGQALLPGVSAVNLYKLVTELL